MEATFKSPQLWRPDLPLPVPNLDDRTWSDLVEEGRAMIPAWAPAWTNHNASEPGITLIELFAYLSEMLLYRLNRVGDANLIEFLKLINGPSWRMEGGLGAAQRSTLRTLAEIRRAVTPGDFEQLAISVNDTADSTTGKIARVCCITGRNLPAEWEGAAEPDASADVSVVVLTGQPVSSSGGESAPELLRKVRQVLDRARLLCTRVHVLEPRYVRIDLQVRLTIRPNFQEDVVRERVLQCLRRFFDPLHGGPGGGGWPFGRDVYLSEIYQLLTPVNGVEEVRQVVATPVQQKRVVRNRLLEVEAIDLGPGELVKAEIAPKDILIGPAEKYANRN
jgi:hypothetical protein